MFQLIEKLNRKSERERQAIAFWASASLTGVIALGWGVSMLTLRAPAAATTAAATETSLPGIEQFQNIGSTAAGFFDQIKGSVEQIQTGMSAEGEAEVRVESDVAPVQDVEVAAEESAPTPTWDEPEL